MDVNRPPRTSSDAADRPKPGPIERLVRTEIPFIDMRPLDMVVLPLAFLVACVVCVPILVLTMLAAFALAGALGAVGLPAGAQGILILVAGLGGGLAIAFVVLLRILRRLPRRVREVAFELDETPPAQAADATLGPQPAIAPAADGRRRPTDEFLADVRRLDAGLTSSPPHRDPPSGG